MKRAFVLFAIVFASLPLHATTWKNVSLMDAKCAGRPDITANADRHSRVCALQCARSGYGAIIEGRYVPFDAKGSAMAKAALSKAKKKDHLRVDITGEMKDDVIRVRALTLE